MCALGIISNADGLIGRTTRRLQQGRRQNRKALEPEGARLSRNLAELGDAHLDAPSSWGLHLTSAEHARAAEVLTPTAGRASIAVSVGTKVQSKDWGRENWRALLGRLATLYPDHALVLGGAPEESEASEFAADGWRENSGNPVVNLCGLLTPRESAAVFARARIFVGHDSGPMHLAAAVDTLRGNLRRSQQAARLVPLWQAASRPLPPDRLLGMRPRNLHRRTQKMSDLDHSRGGCHSRFMPSSAKGSQTRAGCSKMR